MRGETKNVTKNPPKGWQSGKATKDRGNKVNAFSKQLILPYGWLLLPCGWCGALFLIVIPKSSALPNFH